VSPGTRYGYRLVVRDVRGAENSAEAWVTAADEVGAPRVMSLAPVHRTRSAGVGSSRMASRSRPGGSIYDLQRARGDRPRPDRACDGAPCQGRPRPPGRGVASGAYFARLEMNGKSVRKIVVANGQVLE
jgi:hypothetical protein